MRKLQPDDVAIAAVLVLYLVISGLLLRDVVRIIQSATGQEQQQKQ